MPSFAPTQVLVLHHDPLVHAGLAATLLTQPDLALESTGNWTSHASGAFSIGPASTWPDVVVADYEYGLAVIAAARSKGGPSPLQKPHVLVVTQRDTEWEIRHALELGVHGYLVLGCGIDELLDGVRAVHRGMRHVGVHAARRLADSVASGTLTCRETDVLRLVAEGIGNKAIARQLDIAVGTVKSHLKAIFEKLNAKSRTEVAAVAERRGLLTLHRAGSQAVFAQHAPRRVENRSPSTLGSAVH